jgi:uncharacterized protein (TIGR02231 family)
MAELTGGGTFEEAPSLTPDQQLLDYGRLRMPPPDRHTRGRLEALSPGALYQELLSITNVSVSVNVVQLLSQSVHLAQTAEQHAPPHRCRYPESVAGFDYAYAVPASVDIPSDGEFHSIPLFSEKCDARSSFVCVPREVLDVYRFAELKNPLNSPLLEGPADIYVGGDFLLTTVLETIPPQGNVRLGLGAEQAIKVARNTKFTETTVGLMGGSTELNHEIVIEAASHLKQTAQLEIRERIPVPREGDDQVKIVVPQVTPAWEELKEELLRPDEKDLKGAYRWIVQLEPGKPRQLTARYVIQIASRDELSGGNRREGS